MYASRSAADFRAVYVTVFCAGARWQDTADQHSAASVMY